jgi:hypothetical protein
METRLELLIASVISRLGSITKTKLLKLLYLFDVEFYRVNRAIFTGFEWRFFHLGPWTAELDISLQALVARGVLTEAVSDWSEFDTKVYRSTRAVDLGEPFDSYKQEAILRNVLNTWGEKTTGEILDYVYFQTEPMEHGVRNQLLDFSSISQELPEIYKRTSSGKSESEIRALHQKFNERISSLSAGRGFEFTPPRYDDEFQEAIEKLDAGLL